MATNIGPKIGIDGEAEYRRQLQNIIQQSKTLDSEMKLLTSQFRENTSEQQKSTSTSKLLREQIDTQRERVTLLTKMLGEAERVYGSNATQTLKWKQAVNEASTQLNKMEGELDDNAKAADDYEDSIGDAAAETIDFGDVLKANLLSDVIMRGFDLLVDKAKEFASNMIDAAAEVRAETSQYEQSFGDMIGEADKAIANIARNSGIIDTRLRGTATGIYAFAKASGADAPEALELMEDALAVAADTAAYYDRSLEDASDTLQSFLKGNFANDAALGVSATEATRNAKAMELFGEKYQDLTEIQKQRTLLQMVKDAQKASGAMGQAAREADGWENVQGNLNETIRQLQSKIGVAFLDEFVPVIKDITDEMQGLEKRVNWKTLASGVHDVFGFLRENGATIATSVASIGAAFAAFKAAETLKNATTLVNGFKTAITALVTGNPIGLAAAGITLFAGAVASLVVYLNRETEEQRAAREATEEYAQAVGDRAEAYRDAQRAAAEKRDADLAELDRVKDLKKELDKLTDSNGRILEKNRERVEMILGDLNAAMGTEHRLVGDAITDYQDLAGEIDNTIKKKRFMILYGSLEEGYTAAIEDEAQARADLGKAESEYIKLHNKIEAEKKSINNQAFVDNADINGKYIRETLKQIEADEKNLETLKQARDDARDHYAGVMEDIGKYEEIHKLEQQGRTDYAVQLMQRWKGESASLAKSVGDDTQDQIDAYYDLGVQMSAELDLYAREFKKGTAGYTREGLAELQRQQEEMTKKAYSNGSDFGQGFINGLNAKKNSIFRTAESVFRVANSAARGALKIGSPSKITKKFGFFYGEGFEIGAKRSLKSATDSIREQFRAISQLHPVTQYGTTAASASAGASYQYGGFSINVYGQAGQSAQDIANAVGAEIQRAINSKKAVFA